MLTGLITVGSASAHLPHEDPDQPQASGDRCQQYVADEIPETVASLIEVKVVICRHGVSFRSLRSV